MTMAVSCICKNVDMDDDDVEEDEEKVFIYPEDEWFQKDKGGKMYEGGILLPIDEDILDLIREERRKEVEMWYVLAEIFFIMFFAVY